MSEAGQATATPQQVLERVFDLWRDMHQLVIERAAKMNEAEVAAEMHLVLQRFRDLTAVAVAQQQADAAGPTGKPASDAEKVRLAAVEENLFRARLAWGDLKATLDTAEKSDLMALSQRLIDHSQAALNNARSFHYELNRRTF